MYELNAFPALTSLYKEIRFELGELISPELDSVELRLCCCAWALHVGGRLVRGVSPVCPSRRASKPRLPNTVDGVLIGTPSDTALLCDVRNDKLVGRL